MASFDKNTRRKDKPLWMCPLESMHQLQQCSHFVCLRDADHVSPTAQPSISAALFRNHNTAARGGKKRTDVGLKKSVPHVHMPDADGGIKKTPRGTLIAYLKFHNL